MDPIITSFKTGVENSINYLVEDLKSIRTGRANPALLETIIVEAYGGETKLKLMELATITSDSPGSLTIQPYDPSVSKDIEKAILKSPLGIQPNVQGFKIIVNLPALSEEQRQKMIKLINLKIEERKKIIRDERDESRKKIKQQLDQKQLTEDQKFRFEKEIDNLNKEFMQRLQEIKEKKEKEIMEV